MRLRRRRRASSPMLHDDKAKDVDAKGTEHITMWKSGAVAQMDRATVS